MPHGGPRTDTGSAMPLVIGMVVCLLLLGAGITAATSAFLARANLQHVCDGAASAAAALAADAVRLACSTDAPITFGPLFGTPTLTVTVQSIAHAVLTPA
jgi:hypothetical protein